MRTNEQAAVTWPTTTRAGFHHSLGSVEAQVLDMGDAARRLLVDAGIALETMDATRAQDIVAADDDVDATYIEIERAIVKLIARQQPVAIDLRRLIALLQTSLHLERVADSAVDIARLVLQAEGRSPTPGVVRDLVAIGTKVRRMLDTALEALHERRSDLCLAVVRMDDQLEDTREDIVTGLVAAGVDGMALGSLLWVDRAARVLGRAGGHAIDIAEAAWFQITGELRELRRGDGDDREPAEARMAGP